MRTNALIRKVKILHKRGMTLREIEIYNTGKIKELRAKILWEGVTALKDRKYIRKFFSSAKIIIPTIIAIAGALFGIIRCIFQ
jgi:hypothetical protein